MQRGDDKQSQPTCTVQTPFSDKLMSEDNHAAYLCLSCVGAKKHSAKRSE